MDPYPSSCSTLQSRPANVWHLIKSFWQTEQRFSAYLFFSIVMVMTVSLVTLNVFYNYWYNYFYDVLQSYGQQGVVRVLMVCFVLMCFYLVLAIYRSTTRFLAPRWRRWLTAVCMGRLLQQRGHCEKEVVGSLVNFSIDLSMGLIGIITTFLMFIYYLLLLSDCLESTLGKWNALKVSDYVMWIGIIYALMGIFFTLKLGRPLIAHTASPYQTDAAGHTKLSLWLRTGCNQMLVILPLLMVFPNHFEVLVFAGWFWQSLSAFNRVQSSFPSIVNSYFLLSKGYTPQGSGSH